MFAFAHYTSHVSGRRTYQTICMVSTSIWPLLHWSGSLLIKADSLVTRQHLTIRPRFQYSASLNYHGQQKFIGRQIWEIDTMKL